MPFWVYQSTPSPARAYSLSVRSQVWAGEEAVLEMELRWESAPITQRAPLARIQALDADQDFLDLATGPGECTANVSVPADGRPYDPHPNFTPLGRH